MTDLHALLKKSIIDREISSPQDRKNIYSEAREAIIRRLFAHKPALGEDEIDQRINSFDTSMAALEDELTRHFSPAAPTEPEPVGELAHAPAAPDPGYAEELALPGDEPPGPSGASRFYDDDHAPAEPEDEDDLYYPEDEPAEGTEVIQRADEGYGELPEEELGYGPEEPGYGDEGFETPPGYQDNPAPADPDIQDYQAPDQGDRWVAPADNGAVRPREPAPTPVTAKRSGISERGKIWFLTGMIAALILALLGVAFVSLTGDGEDGVTVALEVRREVSDAGTASRIPEDDLAVLQTYVLFDGQDPTIFETVAENPVRFEVDETGSYARISSSAGASGSRILIGPGLASELAGKWVRVRLQVRSSRERGALAMRFAYQSGIAISHWQTANLQEDYGAVGLIWRVPSRRTSVAGDYIIIEPGIPGDGSGTDIKRAEIDIIDQ